MTGFLEQLSPTVKVSNNAVGGTTSETAARCFGALVDAEADLVFLEFGINDRCVDEPPSAGAVVTATGLRRTTVLGSPTRRGD